MILRRTGGKRAFNKPWKKYQKGFGVLERDFWLGLDAMHKLTTLAFTELRVDLQHWNSTEIFLSLQVVVKAFHTLCTSTTGTAIVSLIRHWLVTGQLDPPSKFMYAKLHRNCLEDLKSLKDLYQDYSGGGGKKDYWCPS